MVWCSQKGPIVAVPNDSGTQMSAHRESCEPRVVILEENNGLVLVKVPNSDGS